MTRIKVQVAIASVLSAGAIFCVGGGAAPAGAACGGVVYHRPAHIDPKHRPPLAIGDSTMLLAARPLAAAGFEANARGCRPVYEGLNLLAQRKRQHRLPKVVLMHLGLNGGISSHLIRRGLDILGPRRILVLVTPRGGHDSRVIKEAGRRYPTRIRVLDWVHVYHGHREYFNEPSPGLHLSETGVHVFVRLAKAIVQPLISRRIQYRRIPGARLAFYTRGSGPALLLNMGSASTMSEWDPALLDRLAAHHRLIIYDYRGIGRSSATPRRGLTIARLADDAAGLLDRLGVKRADVLGWSLGGFVAQQIAIRHPEKVSHLILAATNPGGSATRLGPKWAQRIDSNPRATDAQQLSTNFERTAAGRRAARAFLRRLETAADSGDVPDDFHVPRNGYLAQLYAEDRWLRSDANIAALQRLAVPTLVADGTGDVLTPPANSRFIASKIPRAQLSLYARAGHAFLFQFSARFSAEVDRFVRNK